jgi:hypothetical protein
VNDGNQLGSLRGILFNLFSLKEAVGTAEYAEYAEMKALRSAFGKEQKVTGGSRDFFRYLCSLCFLLFNSGPNLGKAGGDDSRR